MGYYQDVVVEFLRENRAVFINTECCIQLNPGTNNDIGLHWYCDALAVDFDKEAVYLCEVTYAVGLGAILKRLVQWNNNWRGIKDSLKRDCKLPEAWNVEPWLFIPKDFIAKADKKIRTFVPEPRPANAMPFPNIIALESIVPWNPSRHLKETAKPDAGTRRTRAIV
jgi:hypothetical protein